MSDMAHHEQLEYQALMLIPRTPTAEDFTPDTDSSIFPLEEEYTRVGVSNDNIAKRLSLTERIRQRLRKKIDSPNQSMQYDSAQPKFSFSNFFTKSPKRPSISQQIDKTQTGHKRDQYATIPILLECQMRQVEAALHDYAIIKYGEIEAGKFDLQNRQTTIPYLYRLGLADLTLTAMLTDRRRSALRLDDTAPSIIWEMMQSKEEMSRNLANRSKPERYTIDTLVRMNQTLSEILDVQSAVFGTGELYETELAFSNYSKAIVSKIEDMTKHINLTEGSATGASVRVKQVSEEKNIDQNSWFDDHAPMLWKTGLTVGGALAAVGAYTISRYLMDKDE